MKQATEAFLTELDHERFLDDTTTSRLLAYLIFDASLHLLDMFLCLILVPLELMPTAQ